MNARIVFLLLVIAWHLPSASARPHQPIDSIDALDQQISVTLEYLASGKIHEAGLLARQLSWRFPDFALGHLIAAEMDSVRALNDVSIADHLPMSRNVSELLLEAQKRLAAHRSERTPEPQQTLPGDLIQLGRHLSHVLVVDLKASILTQYDVQSQTPTLVREHYIGSGEGGFGKRLEGDLKTPLGVYTITEFRADELLPDLYGAGALTLDYPNALDQHLGRTGYGIWLHGVPSLQRSRTPYSSEGCVTMSNEHLSRLSRELDASTTKVLLTNETAALDNQTRKALQQQFHQLFKTYQQAQITKNLDLLPDFYNEQAMRANTLASYEHGLTGPILSNKAPEPTSDMFEEYRFQLAYSSIQPEDISIFRHPDISDRASPYKALMVTEAIFGPSNEYQITVYWAQDDTGNWRVLTDTILKT